MNSKIKYEIDEISFNNDGEYLDITINNLEKYLTLKITDSESFNMGEDDWKFVKNKIDEIFKNLKK